MGRYFPIKKRLILRRQADEARAFFLSRVKTENRDQTKTENEGFAPGIQRLSDLRLESRDESRKKPGAPMGFEPIRTLKHEPTLGAA